MNSFVNITLSSEYVVPRILFLNSDGFSLDCIRMKYNTIFLLGLRLAHLLSNSCSVSLQRISI